MVHGKVVPLELLAAHRLRRLGVTISLSDAAVLPARLAGDLLLVDQALRRWEADAVQRAADQGSGTPGRRTVVREE